MWEKAAIDMVLMDCYAKALLIIESLGENSELHREATRCLSALLHEKLPSLEQKIEMALQKEDQALLESYLEVLATLRNHFCIDREDITQLIPLYKKLLPFFSKLRSPSPLNHLLLEGQTLEIGELQEPYVKTLRQALKQWDTAFANQEVLVLFADLLKTLALTEWEKGINIMMAILGRTFSNEEVDSLTTLSPITFFESLLKKRFHEHGGEPTTLLELVFQRAAFCDDKEDLSLYMPLIREGVSYLIWQGAPLSQHEKFYRTLSQKIILEPLRELYLSTLFEGEIYDHLTTIPNRAGVRRATHIEQSKLREQLLSVTQADPSPVAIQAPFFKGERYLKPGLISILLDAEGNLIKQYSDSLHPVVRLEADGVDLHLKQKPSHPMQEYAVYTLTSRLTGTGVPPSELVRFQVNLSGIPLKTYPVLISQTIVGENFKDALRKNPHLQVDQEQLTDLLLLGLLTRPGDARAANFIFTPSRGVYSIDNDVSFVEPLVKTPLGQTVNFCSILHCLDRQPLHAASLKRWSQLSPDLIFAGWIEELVEKEKEYFSLFSEPERKKLYEEDLKLQFTPQLLLRAGTITTLYTQLFRIQDLNQHSLLDSLSLLNHLIILTMQGTTQNLGERLYKAYAHGYAKTHPSERLKGATDRKQEASLTTPQALKASIRESPHSCGD